MLFALNDFLMFWFFQPEGGAGGGAAGGGGGGGGASGGPPGCAGGGSQFLLLGGMLVVFYFLLIRPQQKQQRERDDMLKSLRKGDKIRTQGGILGEVVEVLEHDVIVAIADKVKVNVLKSHVASVDRPKVEPAAERKDEKKG